MQTSLDLAAMGYEVFLVEKEKELGGNLKRLHTIFPTNQKADEILDGYVGRIEAEKKIKVFTGSSLLQVDGEAPAFKVIIDNNGKKADMIADAIVLATGFTPYDVVQKKEYGFGRCRGVVSALDFERMLKQHKLERSSDSEEPNSVVFVQCVGFRDARANEYCSSFCCKDTVKNATLLKKEHPETIVAVLYMDIRTPSLCEHLYSEAKDLGVKFIRSRPAEIYEKNGKIAINYENTLTGKVTVTETDLVVLSVGAVPSAGTEELAKMLNLTVSGMGFFEIASPPSGTQIPGVFLAGATSGPKDISRSISEAGAAAAQVGIMLRKKNGKD